MKALVYCCLALSLLGCEAGSGEFLPQDEPEPPTQPGDLLTQIQDTIFTPICTECHIGSQAPLGLRLDNVDIAFESLVNVPAIGNPMFDRVKPNDPDNSFIVLKITGDPRAGQRMPLGRTPLSDSSIQLIKDWISQGALPAEQSQLPVKVSSTVISQTIVDENKTTYIITFNAPVLLDSISYDSIFVYELYAGEEVLLPISEYQINVISNRQIELQILRQHSVLKNLKLVLNAPQSQPILNQKGQVLDGNNNNLEGGRYEYHFR